MEPLTGLDAAFLYLESEQAPMHVGGVYLLEGKIPDGKLTFERFRQLHANRLDVSRVFRQRLVELPLNLGHPYWIEDPDFDLDKHILHVELVDPGGWKELQDLVAGFFSTCLKRDRPLWEAIFVEGLKMKGYEGCCAVVSKVHHAGIDGVSGAEILGAILDPTPEPGQIPVKAPWQPDKVPSTAELLARTYGKAVSKTLSLTKFVGRSMANSVKMAATGDLRNVKPPPFPFAAPRSLLNVPVTARRTYSCRVFDLARFKRARKLIGATVNDMVLAVCAGALRAYLLGRDDLPEKPLVAMAPISTRGADQKGAMGNQVSGMLVSLATDLADPLERMATIMLSSRGSKMYSKALKVTDLMEFLPSETTALASRLYTRIKVADKHRPFFNCVITNVPGPQVPLYMAGAKMLVNVGMAPIFDGMGLILVITSYNGTLAISATSCDSIMPDVGVLTKGFDEAMQELEEALSQEGAATRLETLLTAGKTPKPEKRDGDNPRLTHTLDDLSSTLDKIEALVKKKQGH